MTTRHTITHADTMFWGNAVNGQANSGLRGVPIHPPTIVSLGAPTTASATNIVSAVTVAAGGAVTPNGSLYSATTGIATLDVARTLQYKAGSAGDTTQTITVTGKDVYLVVMTETITLNGTTTVAGKKAFKTVTGVSASAALTTTLSIGTNTLLGLPYAIAGAWDIIQIFADSTRDTTATIAARDTTSPATATTGDVRGTINPASAPDGSKVFRVYFKIASVDTSVNAFGVVQA